MKFGSRSIAPIAGAPLIVSGAALLSASTLLPAGPARTMLVLPLALLLPGWALLIAVTGSGDRRDAGLAIGLSAMLSISLFVLIALAMSAASVPLRARNFVIWLDVVLVVLAMLIHARERVTRSRAEEWPGLAGAARSRVRVSYRSIAVAVAVAALGGTFAALLQSYSSVRPVEANENPWLGLSLVGPLADTDAALSRTPGERVPLQVEVTNHTRTAHNVQALLQVDGGAWRSAQPQVVGPRASRVEQVELTAPSRPGLHQVVLAIEGSPGVPGASVGTWMRVVPKGR